MKKSPAKFGPTVKHPVQLLDRVKEVSVEGLNYNAKSGLPYLILPNLKPLTNSIQANGVVVPLLVRPNGEIVNGFRRWLVCSVLGIEQVCVVPVSPEEDIGALQTQLLEPSFLWLVKKKFGLKWPGIKNDLDLERLCARPS